MYTIYIFFVSSQIYLYQICIAVLLLCSCIPKETLHLFYTTCGVGFLLLFNANKAVLFYGKNGKFITIIQFSKASTNAFTNYTRKNYEPHRHRTNNSSEWQFTEESGNALECRYQRKE